MSDWEGKERRTGNITLYDVLLEVREVKSDLKNIAENFKSHLAQDTKDFDSVKSEIKILNRFMWLGLGGIAGLQFLMKWIQ